MQYPQTRKVEQVDDYHGTKVADPYRWLEDDNSAETLAWVTAQNQVTQNYLEQIPYRSQIKQRLQGALQLSQVRHSHPQRKLLPVVEK